MCSIKSSTQKRVKNSTSFFPVWLLDGFVDVMPTDHRVYDKATHPRGATRDPSHKLYT